MSQLSKTMKTRLFNFLILIVLIVSCTSQSEDSDWRGPNRDGIYPETGLLKEWPEEGPDMLWSYEGLGIGHNAVAVANGRVYVTGIKDSASSTGTLYTFDTEGNLLWEKDYGKEFTENFYGTRSTPVIKSGLIYIESGAGAVYCLDALNGEEIWSKDFFTDFGLDSSIQFGYSESVLIHENKLICVPGDTENNVVALDPLTGDLIWASKGYGEQSTYNSPIMINVEGREIVIAMTASSIMGIDVETGEMYWRIEHTQRNKIHANTPLYYDGKLVVASPDPVNTSGLVQIGLSDEGRKAEVLWRHRKFRGFMGGIVRIDTCIYGSAYMRADWQVISWNTGEMLVQNEELGGGSVIWADGLFYCYAEKDGEIALVKAGPESFEIISKFKIPLGSKEHWAHPVIHKGILYIRHGDALMAYDISAV